MEQSTIVYNPRSYNGKSTPSIKNFRFAGGKWGDLEPNSWKSYPEKVADELLRRYGFLRKVNPEDIKEVEKLSIKSFAELGPRARPINNYSHPFDFGRTFLFRFAGFPETGDTEMREKIFRKSMELCAEAMKKYRAVPLSGMGVEDMEGVKAHLNVLGRIKKALDPNNILNRAVGDRLFKEVE